MEKKGQITVFVIIGIVIVSLIVMLYAFRTKISLPFVAVNLQDEMQEVKGEIQDCLKNSASEPVERIGLQGGYLSPPPGSYRLFNDTTVSYLCYNQVGKPTCTNRLLTLENMQDDLLNAIEEALPECLEVDVPGSVELQLPDTYKVKTDIQASKVVVVLDYPITLVNKRSGDELTEKEFTATVDAPLGDLYNVAMDIVDSEATGGRFDVLTYVLSKISKYTIYPHKPYPDKLYQIKLREGSYIFQMAIEDEPG